MKLLCWLRATVYSKCRTCLDRACSSESDNSANTPTPIQNSSRQYVNSCGEIQHYIQQAHTLQLAQRPTWQALMYRNAKGQSDVQYAKYFVSAKGAQDLQAELDANIEALFKASEDNASVRCQFPARSQWLIQVLEIPPS